MRVQAPPVAWKSPGKCRNAFTGAFLCIIAIQLFNAAAVDCISQRCRLNAALISWLAIKFAINDFWKEYNRVER